MKMKLLKEDYPVNRFEESAKIASLYDLLAIIIGIGTYLLRNSYGEEDDPNANNEYELTFEVSPNLVFWLDPKDFE